jgi:hypothetical protein
LLSGTPVDLYDLAAEQDGADVVVRWRTRDERDVAAYRVFRGRDPGALAPLAPDVLPHAEGTYVFRDVHPEPGTWIYRIGEVASDGAVLLHGSTGIHVSAAVPLRPFLDAAMPNPFNPSTTLRFGIAAAGALVIDVFDARGRRVRGLRREAHAPAGFHRVTWDGRDDAGRRVASGAYVVRMQAQGALFTRRVILVK